MDEDLEISRLVLEKGFGDSWECVVAVPIGLSEPFDAHVSIDRAPEHPSRRTLARVVGLPAQFERLWPTIRRELAAMTDLPEWKAMMKLKSITIHVDEDRPRWRVQVTLSGRAHDGMGYFIDFDDERHVGSGGAG